MKRKTNLFYRNSNSNDNKFITFSNYTEDLTATVLATDWKIYPNRFICCKFKEGITKETLIPYLVKYYENKLAFARDNESEFAQLYPLSWLFYILDGKVDITFVGDVTERDYNGIYSDMYITIDSIKSNQVNWSFSKTSNISNETLVNCTDVSHLYGWYDGTEYMVPSDYSDYVPIFDKNNKYSKSALGTFGHGGSSIQDIEFDMIIPLYVIMNINPNTETDYIDETDLNAVTDQLENAINIPLGIWFADDTITVKKDTVTIGGSWTLVLASQFKPFPYGDKMPDETSNGSNMDRIYNTTFAQVLAAHTQVMDQYSEMLKNMTAMSKRISELETQVSLLSK